MSKYEYECRVSDKTLRQMLDDEEYDTVFDAELGRHVLNGNVLLVPYDEKEAAS